MVHSRTTPGFRLSLLFLAAAMSASGFAAASAGGGSGIPPEARPWREVLTPAEGHTVTGDVRLIPDFPLPQFQTKRRLWVYLPPDYTAGNRRYPVLYMHDGQNVFDAKTAYAGEWRVDETLETLFAEKKSSGIIVVAVENGGRTRSTEYIPNVYGKDPEFQGEKYAAFVAETLKPWVDAHFRTLPGRTTTGVAGSSAGAIISFYIGSHYPERFSRVGAFSFTVPGSFETGFFADSARCRPLHPERVLLHIGDEEAISRETSKERFVENIRRLHGVLRRNGFRDPEAKLDVRSGGEHNEKNWAVVFPEAIRWLFP